MKLATLVSRLFDPFLMLAIVFVLLLWESPQFFPAFFSMIVLPFLLFVVAWKTGFVSNWDVSDRRERPKILWPLMIIELICMVLFQTIVFTPVLLLLVGFILITHFWKISGHVMCATLAVEVCIWKLGWAFWPLVFIIPLVAWARVVRKDHTLFQVIFGALYSVGILLFL